MWILLLKHGGIMQNIIVCNIPKEKNDLINFFTEEWIKSLKKINDVNVVELDCTSNICITSEIKEMLLSNNCNVLFYNNCGFIFNDKKECLWSDYKVDVYNFLLDHPRNYFNELENAPDNMHIICLDEDHVEFIRRFYPNIKDAIYLPDSGVKTVESIKPYNQRDMDVLYCGNCQVNKGFIILIDYLPDNGKELYDEAVKDILNNPSMTAEKAIENYLIRHNLKHDLDTLYDLIVNKKVSRIIEDIVRREYKLMIMHALDMAGIHVDIYGRGWQDDKKPFSDNIRIHDRVTPYECHKLIGDAKIDLSIMPWFKRGSSEKPFAGMLNGAVCVSDTSTYLEDNYIDGVDIMLFDLNHIEKAVSDIKWLLDNPDEAEMIARNGYYHALDSDSTDGRVKQILEIMRAGKDH